MVVNKAVNVRDLVRPKKVDLSNPIERKGISRPAGKSAWEIGQPKWPALLIPNAECVYDLTVIFQEINGRNVPFIPPAQMLEPEMSDYVNDARFYGVIDVSATIPVLRILCQKVSIWEGFTGMSEAVNAYGRSDSIELMHVKYLKKESGGKSAPGKYEINPRRMTDVQKALITSTIWPTVDEVIELLEPARFEELKHNFLIADAWKLVEERQAREAEVAAAGALENAA